MRWALLIEFYVEQIMFHHTLVCIVVIQSINFDNYNRNTYKGYKNYDSNIVIKRSNQTMTN